LGLEDKLLARGIEQNLTSRGPADREGERILVEMELHVITTVDEVA
jgi:hypothetical protein